MFHKSRHCTADIYQQFLLVTKTKSSADISETDSAILDPLMSKRLEKISKQKNKTKSQKKIKIKSQKNLKNSKISPKKLNFRGLEGVKTQNKLTGPGVKSIICKNTTWGNPEKARVFT